MRMRRVVGGTYVGVQVPEPGGTSHFREWDDDHAYIHPSSGVIRCPLHPPRSTPRCSTERRPASSHTPRSTAPLHSPSSPPFAVSPRQSPMASSSFPGAARSSPRARWSRAWSPAQSPSLSSPIRLRRATTSTSHCTLITAPRTSSRASWSRSSRSRRSAWPRVSSRCSSRICGMARPFR